MTPYKDNVKHIDKRMIEVGGEERPKFCWRLIGQSFTNEKYRYCQGDYCMAWDVSIQDCFMLAGKQVKPWYMANRWENEKT